MKPYVKENPTQGELLLYKEVLNRIAGTYNEKFSLLVLPTSLPSKEGELVLPFFEGRTYNDVWNESTGGSLLGTELSDEVPQILYELSLIDTRPILENSSLQMIPKLAFDHESYGYEAHKLLRHFTDADILTAEEAVRALNLMSRPFESPMVFNNGDFYPRNFIRNPNDRIVLIDWETWNENSRANVIDHPENVAAFCFVHMWGNPAWQESYVSGLRQRFSFNQSGFQSAILIKSLEMANFWFGGTGRNELCDNQIRMFRNALSNSYMESLWK